MTSQPEVPFDDMYACVPTHWYENPYVYLLGGCAIGAVLCVWYGWRWIRPFTRRSEKEQVEKPRRPSYWADRLDTAHGDEQQEIYTDFIRYIKYTIQQCYNTNSMALTDSELITWAWEHMDSEYAQQIQTIVQHAQDVRFQNQPVSAETLRNDYMIVNKVVSYIKACDR